ncbi:MAG: M56 family metallopeptidase [Mycobacterium kyogaense]|uniref:M56 family metallopeptidase n=1 Tax=Mycobacterium kyogaense TaxID=2212479 RepID=UPI002FF70384
MNAALCVLLYGAAVVWLAPPLLRKVSRAAGDPRLLIAMWLTAIAIALASWVVGVAGVTTEGLGRHAAAPLRYCLDAVLAVNDLGWAGHLVFLAGSAAVLATTVVIARRLVLAINKLVAGSRRHADAAHILGTPSGMPGVVVVHNDRPAAYCVAGRPDAIVVTSAAVSTLGERELDAVLAHERAHLAGRHPQMMMVLRALAGSLPRLPLFRAATETVGSLLEMRADDAAVRRYGSESVLGGLISLAGAPRAPGGALGAADTAVLDRARRLATPAAAGALLAERLISSAMMIGLVVAPVLISLACHP